MKINRCHICILLILLVKIARAQNNWTQKTDYEGTAMVLGTTFTIGDKGYMGIGAAPANSKDFWEYDPQLDSWIQKADFPGEQREGSAVGFSIGLKGYVGTGFSEVGKGLKDFWEYDSQMNSWTEKADFGGGNRYEAIGFSIEGKGYIGLGSNSNNIAQSDLWEYDPSTNIWSKKANFIGGGRESAEAFTIEKKAYVSGGAGIDTLFNDLWEYDPSTNSWNQKADFAGEPRFFPVSFSIGNKGYIGTGVNFDSYPYLKNDFWEYDASNNTWNQVADFGGGGTAYAVGFSINGKGYTGTGATSYEQATKDFWEYSPSSSSTCEIATGEFADKITNNSAKLHWSAVSGAEGYKVRYKVAGTSEWTKRTTSDTSKKISGLQPNNEYVWEIKTYCTIAPNKTSDWSGKQYFTTLPARLSSSQGVISALKVTPNPFSSSANISFNVSENSHAIIELFDLAGRKIKTLMDKNSEAGINQLLITSDHLSAGVYILQLKTEDKALSIKIAVE